MRKFVQFQNSAPAQDASGSWSDIYTNTYSCRGRFRQKSGYRKDESGQLVRNKSFELVVRFTVELLIGQDLRAIIDTVTYLVTNVELIDEGSPRFYILTLAKNG